MSDIVHYLQGQEGPCPSTGNPICLCDRAEEAVRGKQTADTNFDGFALKIAVIDKATGATVAYVSDYAALATSSFSSDGFELRVDLVGPSADNVDAPSVSIMLDQLDGNGQVAESSTFSVGQKIPFSVFQDGGNLDESVYRVRAEGSYNDGVNKGDVKLIEEINFGVVEDLTPYINEETDGDSDKTFNNLHDQLTEMRADEFKSHGAVIVDALERHEAQNGTPSNDGGHDHAPADDGVSNNAGGSSAGTRGGPDPDPFDVAVADKNGDGVTTVLYVVDSESGDTLGTLKDFALIDVSQFGTDGFKIVPRIAGEDAGEVEHDRFRIQKINENGVITEDMNLQHSDATKWVNFLDDGALDEGIYRILYQAEGDGKNLGTELVYFGVVEDASEHSGGDSKVLDSLAELKESLEEPTDSGHSHGHDPDNIVIENNDAFLMAMGEGSRIEIHAADAEEKESWVTLDKTLEEGSDKLVVDKDTGWQPGDKIAITSSDFQGDQAEEFTVLSVSADGKTITLDRPADFMHWGETQRVSNGEGQTWTVDERAQVSLLSRNVTIQGDEDSKEDGFGGHTMVMHGAEMHINGAEFANMGQEGILGRYPIHWHMLGDDGAGQYVTNVSIHGSFNKGITIHGTNDTLVENNVIFNTLGHGVFFEDGSEIRNLIKGNLAFDQQAADEDEALITSDFTGVSSFWITNKHNDIVDNVAGGSESTGFWYAIGDRFDGASHNNPMFEGQKAPHRETAGLFTGNSAHSNDSAGFRKTGNFDFEGGINAKSTHGLEIVDFNVFKNSTWSMDSGKGTGGIEVYNSIIAGASDGLNFNADFSISDSLSYGQSENKGKIDTKAEREAGHSIGEHGNGSLDGLAFYSGEFQLRDSHFALWGDEDHTAITSKQGSGIQNVLDGVTFERGFDRVTDFTNETGGRSSRAIYDRDGTISGEAGVWLVDSSDAMNISANSTNATRGGLTYNVVADAKIALISEVGTTGDVGSDKVFRYTGLGTMSSKDDMLQGKANRDQIAFIGDGQEYVYVFDFGDRPLESQSNQIFARNLDEDEWVFIATPNATEQHHVNGAIRVGSFDDLRNADSKAYFYEDGMIYTKLFGDDDQNKRNRDGDNDYMTFDKLARPAPIVDVPPLDPPYKVLHYTGRELEERRKPEFEAQSQQRDADKRTHDLKGRELADSDTVNYHTKDARWSENGIWSSDKAPGPDDILIIGKGQRVILDKSVTVKAILIDGGELIVEDGNDIDLTADWVLVLNGGLFQVGTEDNPFRSKFNLTLTGDNPDNDVYVSRLRESRDDNVVRAEDAQPYDGSDPGTQERDMNGTNADDELDGTSNDDVIDARGGDDKVMAGDGADTVSGGRGDDIIHGEAGADVLHGSQGNDAVSGGAGNDMLYGDIGNDTLFGGAGDDRLEGGDGNDELLGGQGNDVLLGGSDDDRLEGGSGEDKLYGGAGNDRIAGGFGEDTIEGGKGNDVLYGDAIDRRGETGADIFKFKSGDGQNTIMDFGRGSDKVVFDGFNSSHTLAAQVTPNGILLSIGDVKVLLAGVSVADFNVREMVDLPDGANYPNRDPNARNDEVSLEHDETAMIDVLANDRDPDGDTLEITNATSDNPNVSVRIVDGKIMVDPTDISTAQTASITYEVSDGKGGTDTATLSVNIAAAPVQDPLAGTDANDTINGTSGDDVINGRAGDDDLRGGAGSDDLYGGRGADSFVFWPGHGDDVIHDFGNGADKIVFRNFNERHTLAVTEGPDGLTLSIGSVSVLLKGVDKDDFNVREMVDLPDGANYPNRDPNARNDEVSLEHDETAMIDVLANDRDPDGDTLEITNATSDNPNVSVRIVDGKIMVDPTDISTAQTASITYEVSDGKGGTDTATLSVNIAAAPVQDPNTSPIAENDELFLANNQSKRIDVLENDQDADGDQLSLTNAMSDNPNFTVDIVNNQLRVTPKDGVTTAQTATLTYTISDGKGGTETATVEVIMAAAESPNVGTSGRDYLVGDRGDNTFSAGDGDDRVDGRIGSDNIKGGSGDDRLFGNRNDDVIKGGKGDDFISGGHGNDILFGGKGDDILTGRGEDDTLTGGRGNDTFVFHNEQGRNVITDFGRGEDKITFVDKIGGRFEAGSVLNAEQLEEGLMLRIGEVEVLLNGVQSEDVDLRSVVELQDDMRFSSEIPAAGQSDNDALEQMLNSDTIDLFNLSQNNSSSTTVPTSGVNASGQTNDPGLTYQNATPQVRLVEEPEPHDNGSLLL